ncbi:MAG: hypothetical protein IMZ61_16250 [Planctomycetes bacterium]|nr:hypothetical protein [Planctomycetota bacterium]
MKMKKTIDVLRVDYKNVTGKEAAIRWNRPTLIKKILDAEILKAGHAAHKKVSQPADKVEVNPEFEKLASDIPNETIDQAATSEQPVEKRGGPREGAGRPVGQTDERARIERLLALEKPDLAVRKFVQGLNLVMAKFTPLPFTSEQVESISLGLTLPLYFWFPSTEGAANKWTLHLQALEYIGGPIAERMKSLNQIEQPQIIKEPENEASNIEKPIFSSKDEKTVTSTGLNPVVKRKTKRPVSKTGSHAK